MARPRLVQEGIPLYGPDSEALHHSPSRSDDDLSMGDDNHHIEQMEQRTASLKGVSSLQRAAAATTGNKYNHRYASNNRQRTEYVIGGAATIPSTATRSNLHSASIPPQHQDYQQWSHTISPANQGNVTQQHAPYETSDHHYHETSSTEMQTEVHQSQHYQPHSNYYPSHATVNHNNQINDSASTKIETSHVIGGGASLQPSVERMEGVQDHGTKMPLVVIDGANVAHAYTDALASLNSNRYKKMRNGKPEPDSRGIQVATDYFLSAGVRVLIVLPQYWLRKKPRPGDTSSSNATMETIQLDILNSLNDKGLIVASPPADDDDAYCLTIAKREETRAIRQRNGEGPGFVLSNDMFRDAQARDSSAMLEHWLKRGRDESIGPGRISYTFCDMGTMDDHGDRILDFVPNPRHKFIIWVEGLHHQALVTNR